MSTYEELIELAQELEPYYGVDKVKSWAVYAIDKDTGENPFDITADGIEYYDKNYIISDEAMPIINKIQKKLREIKYGE